MTISWSIRSPSSKKSLKKIPKNPKRIPPRISNQTISIGAQGRPLTHSTGRSRASFHPIHLLINKPTRESQKNPKKIPKKSLRILEEQTNKTRPLPRVKMKWITWINWQHGRHSSLDFRRPWRRPHRRRLIILPPHLTLLFFSRKPIETVITVTFSWLVNSDQPRANCGRHQIKSSDQSQRQIDQLWLIPSTWLAHPGSNDAHSGELQQCGSIT